VPKRVDSMVTMDMLTEVSWRGERGRTSVCIG
jgi:hypothetical protein